MSFLNRANKDSSDSNTNQRIAIAGALRTGTNYLRFLLEQNYLAQIDQTAFGWKHGGISIPSVQKASDYGQTPIAYVVKHPLAFVRSLYRYHELKNKKNYVISLTGASCWSDFIAKPIEVFDSQLEGSPRMRFGNPIQYWNYIYWNLETLDRRKFKIVGFNYEELLKDPEKIRILESVAKLTKRQDAISIPHQTLDRGAEMESISISQEFKTASPFDSSMYLEKRYEEVFTRSQRQFIRDQADPWLMERRGYFIEEDDK